MKHTTFTTKSIGIIGYSPTIIGGVSIYQNYPAVYSQIFSKETIPDFSGNLSPRNKLFKTDLGFSLLALTLT